MTLKMFLAINLKKYSAICKNEFDGDFPGFKLAVKRGSLRVCKASEEKKTRNLLTLHSMSKEPLLTSDGL